LQALYNRHNPTVIKALPPKMSAASTAASFSELLLATALRKKYRRGFGFFSHAVDSLVATPCTPLATA
jgi:hypothetical protein